MAAEPQARHLHGLRGGGEMVMTSDAAESLRERWWDRRGVLELAALLGFLVLPFVILFTAGD